MNSPADSAPAARRNDQAFLGALIASRICHDLANPIGAIANGVELLGMAGAEPGSAELGLVADSVAHAAARLRFLRVAFGVASTGQALGRAETALILQECYGEGRLRVHWPQDAEERPRAEVKAAFLLLQCLESALPRGGEIHVVPGQVWRLEASAERIAADPALWELLDGRPPPEALRPGEVQFALAPVAAAAMGRAIRYEQANSRLAIAF